MREMHGAFSYINRVRKRKMGETTAKERGGEQALEELSGKIVKLSAFLFGNKILAAKISGEMQYQMKRQLVAMQEDAETLQTRLRIWDETDAEL